MGEISVTQKTSGTHIITMAAHGGGEGVGAERINATLRQSEAAADSSAAKHKRWNDRRANYREKIRVS